MSKVNKTTRTTTTTLTHTHNASVLSSFGVRSAKWRFLNWPLFHLQRKSRKKPNIFFSFFFDNDIKSNQHYSAKIFVEFFFSVFFCNLFIWPRDCSHKMIFIFVLMTFNDFQLLPVSIHTHTDTYTHSLQIHQTAVVSEQSETLR